MSKFTYGFDFDGVIHTSIGIPELNGQRHCISTIDNLKPNLKIINYIKELIKKDNYIEIISSRKNQDEIVTFLERTFNSNERSRIEVIRDAALIKKTDTVIVRGVDEFYDDSVNVLKDIIWRLNIKDHRLKLFLVRPELDDFIEVSTIKELENELLKLNIRLLNEMSIKNEINENYLILKKNINISINDPQNLKYVIEHQKNRFLELENILTKNPVAQILIAADITKKTKNDPDEAGHLHSLGTGIARGYWKNKIDCETMLKNIDNLVEKLMKKFPGRINFGWIRKGVIGKDAISKNMIHVWGAHYTNWNLQPGTLISGAGQAAVIGIQKQGVFGIITTNVPDSDIKQILSESNTNHLE
jgi:hypothetical protein